MKRKSVFYSLFSMLLVILVISAHYQERSEKYGNKSFFLEFGGSGVAVITGNADFRFLKGRNDGPGMRIGIGGESSQSESLFGGGGKKNTLFTVPLEFNYVFGKNRLSFEIGYSFTYIYQKTNSNFNFRSYSSSEYEEGNCFVSYMPVGLRLKPKTNGFMLKFNMGPLIDYSAPNLFYYDKIQAWIGLAMGYSFY